MATGKSDKSGGHRSAKRHAGELTIGGSLALLIVSFLPEGAIDPFQATLLGTVLTGGFSQGAKLIQGGGIGKMLKFFGVGSLVFMLGCGVSIGRVTPEEFTGNNGETIIACTLEGFQLGVFDGGVCRNVEGGQIGDTFVDLTLGLGRIAMAAIGGIFSAFGSAGAAITADSLGSE